MYSLVIKQATILDGTGKPPWVGDIGIEGDKIVDTSRHIKAKAAKTLDAQGLVLAPGFVDIQNHSDSYWQLLDNPSMDSLLAQGFTTILVGNCGASLAPLLSPDALLSIQKWHPLKGTNINWVSFAEYADALAGRRFGCNVASLVGYGTLRRGLIGDQVRSLTTEETETLKSVLAQSLATGAFGLSTGLSYSHEVIISELELFELTKIVKSADALLSVHLRNEAESVVESLEEAIDLAAHTGVNLKISHLKVRGSENFHYLESVLNRLEAVYHKGLPVSFDVYPYDSIWQPLYLYLPKWAIEGGRHQLISHIQNPEDRKKLVTHLHNIETSLADLIIASTAEALNMEGKSIGEIAKSLGTSSEDATLEILKRGGTEVLVFDRVCDYENVKALYRHPLSMVASDGAGFGAGTHGKPLMNKLVHPRCFGGAIKFLQEVVADKSLPLEMAIHKLTSAPAKKMGLVKRGEIAVGNIADIVLFDPKRLSAKATLKSPFKFAEGVEYVFVGGQLAMEKGALRAKLHGQFLRKGR